MLLKGKNLYRHNIVRALPFCPSSHDCLCTFKFDLGITRSFPVKDPVWGHY